MSGSAIALALLAGSIAIGVPAYALWERRQIFAIATVVILVAAFPAHFALCESAAQSFPAAASWLYGGFGYGFAAAGVHLAALVRARLRPLWFRIAISIPGLTFIAAGVLTLPWLLTLAGVRLGLRVLGLPEAAQGLTVLEGLPVLIALLSLPTSLRLRRELVRLDLDTPAGESQPEADETDPPSGRTGPATLRRLSCERHRQRRGNIAPAGETAAAGAGAPRPLRIAQIADPHLGPWQSVPMLRRSVAALVGRAPDLVLLTGDYLTMESQSTPGALASALTPLRALPGRCFAILGNHDDGARAEVRRELAANGVRLLLGEEARVDTAAGSVQILGPDWVWTERRRHVDALLAQYPRREDHLRLLLLHDPSQFAWLPPASVDLALAGHTHGGQLGLLSLGLSWTVLTRSRWPDHGYFAAAGNRLYVHRGTGFYGFPMRIGVPGEASVLEIAL